MEQNLSDHKSQIIAIIKKRSLQKGPIRLASGKVSNFYIDLKQTILDPQGLDLLSDLILEFLNKKNLVGVAGSGIGALPLTTAVTLKSLNTPKPFLHLYIRSQVKEWGTKQVIEGTHSFQPKDKVWILEDVVTTGGSSLYATQKCQEFGLQVEGILTCVDRQEGGREKIENKGIHFHSLIHMFDLH